MFTPAERLTADRESSNQARALRGWQETLNRHPRARIYARLARTRRRSVMDSSVPNKAPEAPSPLRVPLSLCRDPATG